MEFEICTSIYSTTLEELDLRLKQAFNYGSNLVEVRIDYLHSFEIDKLKSILSSYMDKCILTCRPISEGGKYNKSEKDRINLLYSLYELQPKFLDIELSLINKNDLFWWTSPSLQSSTARRSAQMCVLRCSQIKNMFSDKSSLHARFSQNLVLR